MSEETKPYRIEGRPQTIFRVKKNSENPYVMIDRRPIDNPDLSFKAKGILTYLMSRPDGWEVNLTDLKKHGKEGMAAIRTGLKELRDARHVCYHAARNVGRITGWLIEVYEIPYDLPIGEQKDGIEDEIAPDDDFLQVENLQVENRIQVLSTLSSTEKELAAKAAKPDLLDAEIHFNLKPTSIRQAIKEYFKLNVNWETKTARQWMEWAVGENITPDQLARAADLWRKDKQFNWQVPSLKGIFEKWPMLTASNTVTPQTQYRSERLERSL